MSRIKRGKANAFLEKIQEKRDFARAYPCCKERELINADVIHHHIIDNRFFAVTCQLCSSTRLYYGGELFKEDIEMEDK